MLYTTILSLTYTTKNSASVKLFKKLIAYILQLNLLLETAMNLLINRSITPSLKACTVFKEDTLLI